MSLRQTTIRLITLVLAVCVLAACTKGTSDVRDWVAKEKARKGAPLPPLPVIKTFESFTYRDQDKRDPFEPSPTEDRHTSVDSGPRPDENRPKEPLEAFALDSLKMVGTIGKAGSHLVALVRDPTGVIHRVHVNDYMGQNYGHVTDIGEDHIDLTELVSNGNGGWMERHASIALEQ
ncbi:pilus assembly protein PilP [Oleiagrimonas sp. C23AA]|uniref:pilus assembly protein PilP n=1 Tax=Oleiagrimonas sp. C23AA TaxID=2719047 RepID=UPI0014213C1C|nr:pilus assembly protein PilP [Oleiagrimonas sp. C23AA]NII09814.1 pilus assembly protein PilP [Oleiagrimonas sp. C23AA]